MVYCLAVSDTDYYIYSCEAEDVIIPKTVSWMSDRPRFDSAAVITGSSMTAGRRAVECFADSSETEFRNFVSPLGPSIIEREQIYIPARGRAMSGKEIVSEMLQLLGDELKTRHGAGRGDRLVIVHPAAVDESTVEVFVRCAAEHMGFDSVEGIPSWLAVLLAQGETPAAGERVLLVEMNADESTVAALLAEEGSGGVSYVPRSVKSSEKKALSLYTAAQFLLRELLGNCDTYDILSVPDSWGKHDHELLIREAMRCVGQLLRGSSCEFSVSGLYSEFADGYVESGRLTPEFFAAIMEREGWHDRVKETVRCALSECGWSGVDRVIAAGAGGAAAADDIRELFPRARITVDSEPKTLPKGALRWSQSGRQLPLCRQLWLCCLTESTNGNNDRWYYIPYHSRAVLQIPCRGVSRVYVLLADAVIREGRMLEHSMTRNLQQIDIPAETGGVSLSIFPQPHGYIYCLNSGRTLLRQDAFRIHEEMN